MYFVSIQTVLEMHWLPTGIGKQMHSNGIWSRKKMAFPEHSNCIQNAFVSESDWQQMHSNVHLEHQKCIS